MFITTWILPVSFRRHFNSLNVNVAHTRVCSIFFMIFHRPWRCHSHMWMLIVFSIVYYEKKILSVQFLKPQEAQRVPAVPVVLRWCSLLQNMVVFTNLSNFLLTFGLLFHNVAHLPHFMPRLWTGKRGIQELWEIKQHCKSRSKSNVENCR